MNFTGQLIISWLIYKLVGSYCTSTALDLRKQVVNNNCRKTSLQLSLFTNKVIWTLSDLTDTPQIIWTLFRSSGHFSDHQDTFPIIWTLFRASDPFGSVGHSSDYSDTFQIIQTLFIRPSCHFADHLGTLGCLEHSSYYPGTFQIIRTLLERGGWRLSLASHSSVNWPPFDQDLVR